MASRIRRRPYPMIVLTLAIVSQLGAPSSAASSETTCTPRQSAYSNVVSSSPGLAGYWRLGEPTGTIACDSTNNKDNGTYSSGATLGVAGAIASDPDTAIALSGSSSQVSVPSAAPLNTGDTFSVEAWVKRGDSKTYTNEAIASKQDGSWVLMFNESDKLSLRRSTVGTVASATVATTDTGAWHYVVATKSGPAVHLYIDGVDVTGPVSNQTMTNNNLPLVIGESTGAAFLKGNVDEVAVYSSVLTPSQIVQHYTAGQQIAKDPVLAAAGDIACPYGDTTNECRQAATASLTAAQKPNAVAVLGDNQYQSGLLSEYNSPGAYNATWGQFNPMVHPAPGNHEYAASSTATGYFTYFGTAAGSGNYSYDLGSWHLIALNSNCSNSGCGDSVAGTSSSAELSWLEADLAAHQHQCVLAYWHHPAFSSGYVGNSPKVLPFWTALYAGHADVVVNGHDHMYERFAQQSPQQNATGQGIREFVVGTGGETLFNMAKVQPNMEAVDNHHFGVLFLTLHASSYEWAFRTTAGAIVDSGSTTCHSAPASGATLARAHALPRASSWPSARRANHVPNQAERLARSLAPRASKAPARLRFTARPLGSAISLSRPDLPIRIGCSRACDLTVTIATRDGTTLARFKETETELSKPYSTIVLHVPRARLARLGRSRLSLAFRASDASGEQLRSRGNIVLSG